MHLFKEEKAIRSPILLALCGAHSMAWHDMLQPPCYTTQLARQFSSLVDSHPVSHTQFIKAPLLMHPHAMPCRSVHFRFVDVL